MESNKNYIYKLNYRFFMCCGIPILMNLIIIGSGASQDHMTDSLKAELVGEFGPKRGLGLYELAYNYADTDYQIVMKYVNRAIKLNEILGDSLMIVKFGRLKSFRGLGVLASGTIYYNN